MDCDAAECTIALDDLSHVNTRPDAQSEVGDVRLEPLRCTYRGDGPLEDGHHPVSGLVDDAAAVAFDGFARASVVGGQFVSPALVTEVGRPARRPLDVA
jgi:hypothetical protein